MAPGGLLDSREEIRLGAFSHEVREKEQCSAFVYPHSIAGTAEGVKKVQDFDAVVSFEYLRFKLRVQLLFPAGNFVGVFGGI